MPVANRVGAENDGWRVTNVTLRFERGTAFVSEMFDLQEFLRGLVDLATRTTRDGAAAFEDRGLRRELGHLAAELDALWAMLKLVDLRGAGQRRPRARRLGGEALLHRAVPARHRGRLRAARARRARARRRSPAFRAERSCYKAMQSLSLTIAAGTSQIQRNIIGERILGLPKDRWPPSEPSEG